MLRHTHHDHHHRKQPDDLDLMTIIITNTKDIKRKIKISWIKGHQDANISYDRLPLRARLNVDADFLATRYRQHGKLIPNEQTDHQPEQQMSLSINGTRIQSQFDACIRFHVNGYHLRQYMQSKNRWTNSTWDEIDFESFGAHFKSLTPSQQTSHMKHVHDQQPLGKRLNRLAPIPDPTLAQCPCCKHPLEDQHHLLTCKQNPDAISAIATLQKTMLPADDIHPLRYLFAEAIQHWIDDLDHPYQPATHFYPPHLHDPIRTAIDSQARIGWSHLLTGLISKEWSILASLDIHTNTKPDTTKGAHRIRKCLAAIHTFTRQLWLSRNSVLHANTEAATIATTRTAEHIEVSYYHQRPHLLRFDDRHLCDRSLQQLLTGSSTTRRRWLRLAKSSVTSHTQDGARQTMIHSFFHETVTNDYSSN